MSYPDRNWKSKKVQAPEDGNTKPSPTIVKSVLLGHHHSGRQNPLFVDLWIRFTVAIFSLGNLSSSNRLCSLFVVCLFFSFWCCSLSQLDVVYLFCSILVFCCCRVIHLLGQFHPDQSVFLLDLTVISLSLIVQLEFLNSLTSLSLVHYLSLDSVSFVSNLQSSESVVLCCLI